MFLFRNFLLVPLQATYRNLPNAMAKPVHAHERAITIPAASLISVFMKSIYSNLDSVHFTNFAEEWR